MSANTRPLAALPAREALSLTGMRAVVAGEVADVFMAVVVAVGVRVPYLWDIPRFTDESNEAYKSVLVLHGRILPLTNIDPYIGPLWNYLLAGVMLVAGPSLYSPRLVAAVLGALTVVPAYVLGRGLGGRWVGLLAAAFLVLSPAHIAVNSHIGWSNCITPLLTTLAIWLTHRSVTRENPSDLAWAGIAWGLAYQTHPTAVLFAPAVAIYVARARPRWLKTGWPWLAAGLALVACSPLVIANVRSNFEGLNAGLRVQDQYGRGETFGLAVYVQHLTATLSLLSDSMSGVLSEFDPLRGPLGAPIGLAFVGLAALGLAQAARRGAWLPVIACVTYLVLLPLVNARFGPSIPKARYIAPLLPLCYAAVGLLVVDAYDRAGRLLNGRTDLAGVGSVAAASRPASLRVVTRGGIVVGVVALLTAPFIGLQTYYRQDIERGRTNADLYATIEAVNAARTPGDRVFIDHDLSLSYTPGGGRLEEHLRFAGSVYGWNRQSVDLPLTADQIQVATSSLLVVSTRDVPAALAVLRLEEVSSSLSDRAPARVFRVLGLRGIA